MSDIYKKVKPVELIGGYIFIVMLSTVAIVMGIMSIMQPGLVHTRRLGDQGWVLGLIGIVSLFALWTEWLRAKKSKKVAGEDSPGILPWLGALVIVTLQLIWLIDVSMKFKNKIALTVLISTGTIFILLVLKYLISQRDQMKGFNYKVSEKTIALNKSLKSLKVHKITPEEKWLKKMRNGSVVLVVLMGVVCLPAVLMTWLLIIASFGGLEAQAFVGFAILLGSLWFIVAVLYLGYAHGDYMIKNGYQLDKTEAVGCICSVSPKVVYKRAILRSEFQTSQYVALFLAAIGTLMMMVYSSDKRISTLVIAGVMLLIAGLLTLYRIRMNKLVKSHFAEKHSLLCKLRFFCSSFQYPLYRIK